MIHIIIVPNDIRALCNEAAQALGIDPDGTMRTLCVPIIPAASPNDSEPTHWGAHGIINDTARLWLSENLGAFPGALWWRYNEGLLIASYNGANLGENWSWQVALDLEGLKQKPISLPT